MAGDKTADKIASRLARLFAVEEPEKPRPDEAIDPARQTLEHMLGRHRSVLVSNVYAVNLKEIVQRFSKDPERDLARAERVSQIVIEEYLVEGDRCDRLDDGAYLLFFPNLTKQAGTTKAVLIAQEIAKRLKGESPAFADIKYDLQSDYFGNDQRLSRSTNANQTAQRWLSRDEARRLNSIRARATRAFEHMVADRGAQQERVSSVKLSVGREDAQKSRTPGPLKTPARAARGLPVDIEFAYRPMWHVQNRLLTAYVCQPFRRTPLGRIKTGDALLPDGANDDLKAQLDLAILQGALNELRELADTDRKALIVVPCHHSTLMGRFAESAYLPQCRSLNETLRQLLVFELVQVPREATTAALQQLIAKLSCYGRAVLERVPPDFDRFSYRQDVRLHAIGVDLSGQHGPENAAFEELEAFAERSAESGLRIYVHGLPSVSLATAAVCAGFDYVDGKNISSLTRSPRGVQQFPPEMLFTKKKVG